MEKVKFALVGCGRIHKKHAEAITKELTDIAELVAVCDIDQKKSQTVGRKYNSKYYTSYDDMLTNHPEVDVVNILTESGNHAKHTLDIVEKYKKHVVVEKPMALTLDDADKMIAACYKYATKLFVVKQNRLNLPVIKLREALDAGRFGKLVMGTVRVRWCRPQEYYDMDNWRGTWSMDGGVFTNQASHHIDLLEWMLGDPVSVFAKSRTALVNIETEDTGVAVLKFSSGAIGLVEATTATRPKDLEGSLSILGEKGSVEIGGFAVNEMKVWNFMDNEDNSEKVINKFAENPPNVYGFGHIRYLRKVCESIINNEPAFVDGLEGRKSLELINAIYESIETGNQVFLRFQPDKCKLGKRMVNNQPNRHKVGIIDVRFGTEVSIVEPVNLYGCEIGENCFIGPFVEIQKGARIGKNCKIQSHSFICELVTIGDNCFISHGAMFINDLFSSGGPAGGDESKWKSTHIGNNVSIGTNATILPVNICNNVVIGAGSVVTKDIEEPGIYAGNPIKLIRKVCI